VLNFELGLILGIGDGKVGPGAEDFTCIGESATLELSLDRPRQGWFAVLGEDLVDGLAYEIFAIDQQAVHVEKTGSDSR
jgi:uncharacterized protein YqfA (UPF0365 family)